MVDTDDIGRDAGRALLESASHVERPEIVAVRSTRRRRTALSAAAAAFAGTLVVVGVVLIGGGATTPGSDVAAPPVVVPDSAPPPASTAPPATPASLFGGNIFVIDDGTGAVVCSGGVMESLPPQCGGPPLDGLDWADVPWAGSAQGQFWADMYVEMRYADGRFELASQPEPSRRIEFVATSFTPPCPAPAGGWVFTPGPGATEADLEAAITYINAQPDRSGHWVFNLVDPPREFSFGLVLVATFTGEVAVHEAAIGELWSGPLCVVERTWTMTQLRAIQDELASLAPAELPPSIVQPGSYAVDETTGVVEVTALIVTDEGRRWLDDRFGAGLVRAVSILEPVGADAPGS